MHVDIIYLRETFTVQNDLCFESLLENSLFYSFQFLRACELASMIHMIYLSEYIV